MLELPHRQVLLVADVRVVRVRHLVEPVHVQLAHEASHIAMLEVPRQRLRKVLARTERKRVALLVPRPPYEVRECRVVQHRVQLVNKSILLNRGVLLFTHFS